MYDCATKVAPSSLALRSLLLAKPRIVNSVAMLYKKFNGKIQRFCVHVRNYNFITKYWPITLERGDTSIYKVTAKMLKFEIFNSNAAWALLNRSH